MTSWAEEIVRNHVQTREGHREAEPPTLSARPAWTVERTDAYRRPSQGAVGTARVERDPRAGNAGRAGRLTPLQARRAMGGPGDRRGRPRSSPEAGRGREGHNEPGD